MNDPRMETPKYLAAVKLLQRTGARTYRVGYSDPEDGEPTVWYAVGEWRGGGAEAAGGLDPITATLRLCEQVIDGGQCAHCNRPTIFDDNPGDGPFDSLLMAMGCVYGWDPELATFRRSCEGES